MKVLTEQAMGFLTKSGSAFACFQPWMSDLISSLIRGGFYESSPDSDPDYQLLILTPLGRRAVQSIQSAQSGGAMRNVVAFEAPPHGKRHMPSHRSGDDHREVPRVSPSPRKGTRG
jgi:hypothetical protein